DYAVLSATEVPSFELAEMATPTSYNPLGAKGIGEAGTIGATPAVQNAIIDAGAHLGVRHIDLPATPDRVRQAQRRRLSWSGSCPGVSLPMQYVPKADAKPRLMAPGQDTGKGEKPAGRAIAFVSRYSARPSGPLSRPRPDCL